MTLSLGTSMTNSITPSFKHLLCALSLAISLLGCNSVSDPSPKGPTVVLVATHDNYAAGESVMVQIKNVSGDTLITGLCPIHLDQEITRGNLVRAIEGGMTCRAIGYTIYPNEYRTIQFTLPQTLATGWYRVTINEPFRDGKQPSKREVRSQPFQVNGAGGIFIR